MLEDLGFDLSSVYQEALQKGFEKGIEEGIEMETREVQQKWLAAQRSALLGVVQMRFPELFFEARKRAYQIADPEVLQYVMLTILAAQDSQEARNHLLG